MKPATLVLILAMSTALRAGNANPYNITFHDSLTAASVTFNPPPDSPPPIQLLQLNCNVSGCSGELYSDTFDVNSTYSFGLVQPGTNILVDTGNWFTGSNPGSFLIFTFVARDPNDGHTCAEFGIANCFEKTSVPFVVGSIGGTTFRGVHASLDVVIGDAPAPEPSTALLALAAVIVAWRARQAAA